MWIIAAIFGVMAIAMIYQSSTPEGINKPWAECKENLATQMLSNVCTPRNNTYKTN
jgi:hypothetical protein